MTYLDLTIDESIGIQYVKEIADKWRVNLLLFALYRTVPCSNMGQSAPLEMTSVWHIYLHQHLKKVTFMYQTEYHMRSDNMSAENRILIAALKMSQNLSCGAKRPPWYMTPHK